MRHPLHLILVAVLTVAVAACGGNDDTISTAASTTTTVKKSTTTTAPTTTSSTTTSSTTTAPTTTAPTTTAPPALPVGPVTDAQQVVDLLIAYADAGKSADEAWQAFKSPLTNDETSTFWDSSVIDPFFNAAAAAPVVDILIEPMGGESFTHRNGSFQRWEKFNAYLIRDDGESGQFLVTIESYRDQNDNVTGFGPTGMDGFWSYDTYGM